MTPFDNPEADVVEVIRGAELDLVALIGKAHGVAFVSIDSAPPVRVARRRNDVWRCDQHGYASPTNPRCRHIDDARRASEHLDIETHALTNEKEIDQ